LERVFDVRFDALVGFPARTKNRYYSCANGCDTQEERDDTATV
jgi:hypothetical protein